jgi:hypothetical protein
VTPSKIPSPAIGTTVTKTDSGTTSVTHRYSDGEQTVIEEYRVYYGDKGETPAPRADLPRDLVKSFPAAAR